MPSDMNLTSKSSLMPSNNIVSNLSVQKSSDVKNKNIWVRETRFGRWFLSTHTWYKYVLSQAIVDFKDLLNGRLPAQSRLLDAGCGQGLAFTLLHQHFHASTIVGIDIDREQVAKAERVAALQAAPCSAVHGNTAATTFDDGSFDMIFCHQLLHHTSQQHETLNEFYRLLAPGGILLVGESCRSFINSVPVRVLFRHPHMAQKDAQGYMELIRSAGFSFNVSTDVRTSRPWWSRRCLGLAQKCGVGKNNNEPTEILIVAVKPLTDI